MDKEIFDEILNLKEKEVEYERLMIDLFIAVSSETDIRQFPESNNYFVNGIFKGIFDLKDKIKELEKIKE